MASVSANEEAIRTLRRHGIEPNAGFIMFEPDSAIEDIRDNFRFLKRNGLLRDLQVTANVLSHHQIVLRGTETFSITGAGLKPALSGFKPAPAYEAVPVFRDPHAGELSSIMRKAAGLVFRRMDDIWSGRTPAPAGAEETCREINDFLMGLFEENLERLSMDGPVDGSREADIIARAEEYMNGMFNRMVHEKTFAFLKTDGGGRHETSRIHD